MGGGIVLVRTDRYLGSIKKRRESPLKRPITAAFAALFALSACDIPVTGPQTPSGPVPVAPVSWKTGITRDQRASELFECELAGRGLRPGATEAEIAQATATSDPAQVERFVKRCLENRGWTVTERPVCTDTDLNRGQFVQRPDFLPPLERVRCVDPSRGGFVVV